MHSGGDPVSDPVSDPVGDPGGHPGNHPGIRGFTFSGAHSTMMGAKRLSAVVLRPPVF